MTEPRSDEGARTLIGIMAAADSIRHPRKGAFSWLKQTVAEYGLKQGKWLDIATADGDRLFQLLEESCFRGEVYAVEAQLKVAKQLLENFKKSGLADKGISLVPIISDAADLVNSPDVRTINYGGQVKRIENPLYHQRDMFDIVSTLQFWHEAESCPRLKYQSAIYGDIQYRCIIEGLTQLLKSGGMVYFDDLHGVSGGNYVLFKFTEDRRGQIAEHVMNWIVDTSYNAIPKEFYIPGRETEDNEFWNEKRRTLLRDAVLKGSKTPHANEQALLNLLTEVAYRVVPVLVDADRGTYLDRDHEIHTFFSIENLLDDFGKKGIHILSPNGNDLKYSVVGEEARGFFLDTGIDISKVPYPIYTAAVLQKQ